MVAGHWDHRFPEAKRRAEELRCLGSVLFLGSVAEEHLAALYCGAVLFVMPSLYEGFGLPVLEAMACGTPVLCSNAGSLVEVGGTAVKFVDGHDVDMMARAMETLLKDAEERDRLRREGLQRARAFSWKRAAAETLSVYSSAVRAQR